MLENDDRQPCEWPLCETARILTVVDVGVCAAHFYTFNDIVDVFNRSDAAEVTAVVQKILKGCAPLSDEELEAVMVAAWTKILELNTKKNLADSLAP